MKNFTKNFLCFTLAFTMAMAGLNICFPSKAKADSQEIAISINVLGQSISQDVYMSNNLILDVYESSGYNDLFFTITSSNKNIRANIIRKNKNSQKLLISCPYNNILADSIISLTITNRKSSNENGYRVLGTRSFNVHAQNPLCNLQTANINMYSDETKDVNIHALYAKEYFNNKYSNINYNELKFTSSNPNVAIVNNNGKITAQNEGTTIITATYNGSFTGYIGNGIIKGTTGEELANPTYIDNSNISVSFTINVSHKIKSISFKENNVNLNIGETYKQEPIIKSDIQDISTTYNWTSSNPNIVSIDENGNIKARQEGVAIITAISQDKSKSVASYSVTIKDNTTKPSEPNTSNTGKPESANNEGKTTIYIPVEIPTNSDIKIDSNGNMYYKADMPTDVKAKANKSNIKVTWNNVANAKSYTILRKTNKGSYEQIGTSLTHSYTDNKVKYKNTYTYKIIATPTVGTIGNSDISINSNSIKFVIKKPKIKTVKRSGNGYKLNIKGTTYSGFAISISQNKKSKKITMAVKGKNINIHLPKGKTYYIKIRAYSKSKGKNIYSKFSQTKKIKA